MSTVSFDNIKNAFAYKSNADLQRAYMLFKAINNRSLVSLMEPVTSFAMKIGLPINFAIKGTIFKQFVGGETIEECNATIQKLYENKVGSILDYSVEGQETEEAFEQTTQAILGTVKKATNNPSISFCVFKVTGFATHDILAKQSAGMQLNPDEQQQWQRVQNRVDRICGTAAQNNVRIFIDAEESWIQQAIDDMANAMMQKYNTQHPIVYNTIQFYRTDRLEFLKQSHQHAINHNYILGIKLVRGAYMEKERKRAMDFEYTCPIQPNKESSDRDYDAGLKFCIEHINTIAICAGTHNEQSSLLLTQLMEKNNIPHQHPHVWFSQLLGMSDHISFNLAVAGYNVCKYVPYGPVKSVMPYLFRRAKENTSMAGQMSRELSLIVNEIKRRKS